MILKLAVVCRNQELAEEGGTFKGGVREVRLLHR